MDQIFCQSCGMPMIKPEEFGTNQDQSVNKDYCSYCYKDGAFTNDYTMDEMINTNVQYLDEYNKDSGVKYSKDEAIAEMKKYFPTLKRWKK